MNLFHNFWFIQVIGAIALIFIVLAWNAKNRKNIFILQSVNLAFFIVHYLLLSAYAGAAMCTVVLARNFVFMHKTEKKWASHIAWLYGFIIVAIGVLIIFWNGWVTILPVLGVVISMYAMWKDKPAQMRFFMLMSCIVWIPYTLIVQSWPGLFSQIIGVIGILVGMYRLDRNNKSYL